jgi:hypothetical protein
MASVTRRSAKVASQFNVDGIANTALQNTCNEGDGE